MNENEQEKKELFFEKIPSILSIIRNPSWIFTFEPMALDMQVPTNPGINLLSLSTTILIKHSLYL